MNNEIKIETTTPTTPKTLNELREEFTTNPIHQYLLAASVREEEITSSILPDYGDFNWGC